MINSIINIINKNISGIHSGEKIYSLAQTLVFESGGSIIQGPGLLSKEDDIKYIGVDDVESIIIYHKINSVQTRLLPSGRGNKVGDVKNNYAISLICFWKMSKVPLLPDEMLLLLQARMPNELIAVENIKTCFLISQNAVLNPLQVYTIEYGTNSEYRLPTDMSIIQYNYQLELTINSDCLKKCINC